MLVHKSRFLIKQMQSVMYGATHDNAQKFNDKIESLDVENANLLDRVHAANKMFDFSALNNTFLNEAPRKLHYFCGNYQQNHIH